MEIVSLLIHVVAGTIAGAVVGALRIFGQHRTGITLLGMTGGILGGTLLNQLGFGIGPLDATTTAANGVAGLVGGTFLVSLVGALRVLLEKDGY